MTDSQSGSKGTGTVSYFETEINCPFCLTEVQGSLAANPDVEVIARSGHRLVEADNGEIVQGSVGAVSVASCLHDQIGRDGEGCS